MKKRSVICALMSGFISLFILSACGPQPKPNELVKLEEMRNSELSAEINGLAPDAYKKCTDLTNKALDSWQEGEQEQASIYAELGQRQYITAKASSDMNEAENRKNAAMKEAAELNAKMDSMRSRLDELNKSIDETKKKISDADPNNSELRIQLAMKEREKAVAVEATEFAKDEFAAADAKLKEASNNNVKGNRKVASGLAEEANKLFVKAYDKAKPAFDKKQAEAQAAERLKGLVADAKTMFDASQVVTTDAKETILVVKGAFGKDSAELSSDAMDMLKKAVDFFKRYPEANIRVEGHAQKGSKDAQGIGQKRASAASDFISGQGIEKSRLTTQSKGKSFLRYDEKKKENRALNDRVELVIVMP